MTESGTEIDVYPGADRPVAVPAEIVLAASKEYRAYLMSQEGHGWDVIAHTENYPSAEAARRSVQRYLAEGRVLVSEWTKAEMLMLHISTLRRLRVKAMQGADEGKLPAMAFVRQLVLDEIALLKLTDDDATANARTVVVMDADYSAILDAVAGE